MEPKTVSSSRVILSEVVEPNEANFLGKAFGGAILAKIDLCAYACASKYAGTIAVTASFDRVDFHEPIEVGELVSMEGTITYVGRTSMEVTIEIYADNILLGTRRHTNTARVTMVGLRDGKPCAVPKLVCETRDDRLRFLQGRLRRETRVAHRAEFDSMSQKLQSLSDVQLDDLIAADALVPLLQTSSI